MTMAERCTSTACRAGGMVPVPPCGISGHIPQAHAKKVERLQKELATAQQQLELVKLESRQKDMQVSQAQEFVEEKEEALEHLQKEVWKKEEDIITLKHRVQELGESGLKVPQGSLRAASDLGRSCLRPESK